jgi:hypothetical protein
MDDYRTVNNNSFEQNLYKKSLNEDKGLICISFLRWGETESTWHVGLMYQPRMIADQCGAVGGMRLGKGNRITRRKPAPVPLCPPQIPHDLTSVRIRPAALGRRHLTVWAMTQASNAYYTSTKVRQREMQNQREYNASNEIGIFVIFVHFFGMICWSRLSDRQVWMLTSWFLFNVSDTLGLNHVWCAVRSSVFWDITPYSSLQVQNFNGLHGFISLKIEFFWIISCSGGLESLHRSPATCRRRQKEKTRI